MKSICKIINTGCFILLAMFMFAVLMPSNARAEAAPGSTGSTAISIAQASNAETPKKGSKSCAPYEEVRHAYRSWGCIFCKPFEIIFNTASVMAKQSYDALAKAVVAVVAVAMALWLAYTVLRYVASMEIQEPRTFVKEIAEQIFRVLVVVLLLNGGLPQILSMSVDPVFSTGLKIAQLAGKISDDCELDPSLSVITAEEGGGLSEAMGNGILCTIKSTQDQIVDILSLGRVCWCLAWSSENRVLLVFPHLGYLFTCICFYLGGFLLLFGYPFLLIDCILKLAIAVALLPAALGAFAFKVTAQYLEKIWNIFLNAVFSFIFLSIIIFIIASIAADTLSEMLTSEVGIFIRIFWWMVEAVKVVGVLFLGWAVMEQMKTFSDAFASSLNFSQDIGSRTGSMAGEFFVKRPAQAVGKPLLQGAKKVGSVVGGAAAELGHRANIRSWKNAADGRPGFNLFRPFSAANKKLTEARDDKGNIMYDKDGNVMYNTTGLGQKILGRKEYRSFSTGANGNTKMNIVHETKKGRKKETTTDSYSTITRRYGKNGELVSTDRKTNTLTMERTTNKNGTYNRQAIEDFMQNSLMSEEERQMTVIRKIMSERLGAGVGDRLLDDTAQRKIETGTDENGRTTWTVTQNYENGSQASFKLTFSNSGNRVLSEYEEKNKNGKGVSLATDGIVQRKTYFKPQTQADGSKKVETESRYAFSQYYSNRSVERPLYSTGEFGNHIPADEIMFGQNDIDKFAKQVGREGNKAYFFDEFK